MKAYFIHEFSDKKVYTQFIEYMLEHSDLFSFVYFRYRENEKPKKSVREIHSQLKKYQVKSYRCDRWPSTITRNDNGHIYQFTLYQADKAAKEVLSIPEGLYDWDYPRYPMDLCFYRKGYAWLATSSHEYFCAIYVEDAAEIKNLNDLGVETEFWMEAEAEELFWL